MVPGLGFDGLRRETASTDPPGLQGGTVGVLVSQRWKKHWVRCFDTSL